MSVKNILITAPSLDTKQNVSGISSVTNFIINNNTGKVYKHFELGRKDDEKRNLRWFLRIIKTMFNWIIVVTNSKTTLVHFNFALSKASIIRDAPLILFVKLCSKKILIHLHGGDYLTNTKAPGWMKFILKRVFWGNTQVIVLSPAEQHAIIKDYKVKNVNVLPNCVDLKEAKAFNRTFNKEGGVPHLLFIGRISKPKGIEYIYQALHLLKKKGTAFKFLMAGTGPDETEYVAKFSSLLGAAFEFKGIVSGEAKTELFKASDVFLLPSMFEGLPMALLESMSFGLVPVVTGVGSIKYVVKTGENGIIVGSNPVEEIVTAIESFEKSTILMERLSINASNFIFKYYNPENYINELNKVYELA
jgi:glycosyltransferase involved in cell wall biosynthesis